MEPSFWLTRWESNEIGFHEGRPNALLAAHWAELGIRAGGRVLVPLCGKSRDLVWLRAQGFEVVGAELSRIAAAQFFAELELEPEVTRWAHGERFAGDGICILVGDLFDLDAATLGAVDAVYDRAALVAMPPAMRLRYAEQVIALSAAAPQLLVTFDYDQALMSGPPFAVPAEAVQAAYGGNYQIKCAETRDAPGGIRGNPATESAWILQQKR